MNNQKAIIYLRKSTDREDRQQISIETQQQYCEKLAHELHLETITIEDRKSAKEEGKRPWFQKMLSICKKGDYDYIIAYDPTRISRNTIDTAYFTELINKAHIKGFYASENRQFFNGEDIFSALMLGISFLMSKADNQMRSSNIKKKMEVLFQKGIVMHRAPFGYKNHQYFNEQGFIIHDVIVVEEQAKCMQEAFRMRLEWKRLVDIAEYLTQNGYPKDSSAVERMLKNHFYIGIQKGKFGETMIAMPWYRPIISCRLFEQVNAIRRKVKKTDNEEYEAPLRYLVCDASGDALVGYETRNARGRPYVYYRGKYPSRQRLNFSEKRLFKCFDEYMDGFDFPKNFVKNMRTSLTKAFGTTETVKDERRLIQDELATLDSERKVLAQKLIAGIFSDEDYKEISLTYLQKKRRLEERITMLSDETKSVNTLIRKWVELLEHLFPIYKTANPRQKAHVLKWIQVELFVGDDLGLTVRENRLLQCVKNCSLDYGTPTPTWVKFSSS